MSYVLGIHDNHNSTVYLIKDGKIETCVSEERFKKKKITQEYLLIL